VKTCGTCHPNANENFVKYDPHADRRDRERNPALYWTAQFMHLLLGGVFAFFGLHTTLWFSKEVRQRRERRLEADRRRAEAAARAKRRESGDARTGRDQEGGKGGRRWRRRRRLSRCPWAGATSAGSAASSAGCTAS
jgi:hypothetical protein